MENLVKASRFLGEHLAARPSRQISGVTKIFIFFVFRPRTMTKMNSGPEDWQEYFDASAYLNTYYGGDMFTRPGRFHADYLSQITERTHRIMATGKITVHNYFRKPPPLPDKVR